MTEVSRGAQFRKTGGHDPGRVAGDGAMMFTDGDEAITDIAMLRGQPELFGPVASGPTVWRVLDGIEEARLAGLRGARAADRELVTG